MVEMDDTELDGTMLQNLAGGQCYDNERVYPWERR